MANSPSELLMKAKSTESVDLIQSVVHAIENLTQSSAFSLASELVDETGFTSFKLGGALSMIYSNPDWYLNEYPSFKAMLDGRFPTVKYRKAMYLIDIYTKLVAAEISWAKVGHLGWTMLKELAPILTKENVDEWVKKAESMTVLQLQEAIKYAASLLNPTSEVAQEEGPKNLTTITFKVYEDQKDTIKDAIKKAKVEASTEFDNVAIECICMSYLAGGSAPKKSKPINMSDEIKKLGYEETIMLVGTLFPELDISVKIS